LQKLTSVDVRTEEEKGGHIISTTTPNTNTTTTTTAAIHRWTNVPLNCL